MRIKHDASSLKIYGTKDDGPVFLNLVEWAEKYKLKSSVYSAQFVEEHDLFDDEEPPPKTPDEINITKCFEVTLPKKSDASFNSDNEWKLFLKEITQQYSDKMPELIDLLKRQYEFSAQKWTRIWFSKIPETFLPKTQQDNIEAFLDRHPNCEVTLFFDKTLLNKKGIEHLEFVKMEWCLAYDSRIKLIDIRDDAFIKYLPNNNSTQQSLYNEAIKELNNLSQGGNPAAASDIIRTLRPAYLAGIYTDFDVEFAPNISGSFYSSSPLVYTTSKEPKSGTKQHSRCNDILAIHPQIDSSQYSSLNSLHNIMSHWLGNLNNATTVESLISLFQEKDDNNINDEFIRNLKTIITHHTDESTNLFFRFRHALEITIATETNINLMKSYRQLLINSVVQTTGPLALPSGDEHSYHLSGIMPIALSSFVKGQSDGVSNELSWIPHPNNCRKNKIIENNGPVESSFTTQGKMKSELNKFKNDDNATEVNQLGL